MPMKVLKGKVKGTCNDWQLESIHHFVKGPAQYFLGIYTSIHSQLGLSVHLGWTGEWCWPMGALSPWAQWLVQNGLMINFDLVRFKSGTFVRNVFKRPFLFLLCLWRNPVKLQLRERSTEKKKGGGGKRYRGSPHFDVLFEWLALLVCQKLDTPRLSWPW